MQSMHNASPSLALVSLQYSSSVAPRLSQSVSQSPGDKIPPWEEQTTNSGRDGGSVDCPTRHATPFMRSRDRQPNPSPIPVVPVCGDVMNA